MREERSMLREMHNIKIYKKIKLLYIITYITYIIYSTIDIALQLPGCLASRAPQTLIFCEEMG